MRTAGFRGATSHKLARISCSGDGEGRGLVMRQSFALGSIACSRGAAFGRPAAKVSGVVLAALAVLVLEGGCTQKECTPADNPHVRCEGASPVLVDGQDTGFELCSSGTIHRPAVVACPTLLPRPAACAGGAGACAKDADCNAGPNGACDPNAQGTCACHYGCRVDTDCAPGQMCVCGDPVGTCAVASCHSDAECAPFLCTTYYGGCVGSAFACQTCADECAADSECGGGLVCGMSQGFRSCESTNCH
jgi:hypothetical protein